MDARQVKELARELGADLVGIASAAHVVGVSETDIRSWINREGMFSEKRRGQGVPFSFTVQDLFNLAAVRALISAGFTIRAACEAIRPYSVYGALLENHDFILSMSAAGRTVLQVNSSSRV